MMSRLLTTAVTAAIALGIVGTQAARGHETDQYSVPAGREFADLRLYFSNMFLDALEGAVRNTNRQINATLVNGRPTDATQRYYQPDWLAWAFLLEVPPVIHHVETIELKLLSRELQRSYPGLVVSYRPTFRIYDHPALVLDITKLVRLSRCSTVMIDGNYLGTDKIVHFVHMGYIYNKTYQQARASGVTETEAIQRAVNISTGSNPISETSLLGMLVTGVRSNADLAANYCGLKFYRSMTERVTLRGEEFPPLLVRDGVYWRLNDHVRRNCDFLSPYVSPHWDEVLNPNVYDFALRVWLPGEIKKRCPSLLPWYHTDRGAIRSREDFVQITSELRTYYGEDYGFDGDPNELIGVITCCFDPPTNGARPSVTVREAPSPDFLGRGELWYAAAVGDVSGIDEALARGAKLDAGDVDGVTPLHIAAERGHDTVVRRLLTAGADPAARTATGATALHLAAREQERRVVRLLLDYGAPVDARDSFGYSPLHDAATRGSGMVAAMLVEAGANPNARDHFGTTPMHLAARDRNETMLTALMQRGGDPRVANAFGRSAIDEARLHGASGLADALSQRMARANTARAGEATHDASMQVLGHQP